MTSRFSNPTYGTPWLIRTDFNDRVAWTAVCTAAALDISVNDGLSADQVFEVVDDDEFDQLTPEGLVALDPCTTETYFLADSITISHAEHPILAVDVHEEPGRSFRLAPAQLRVFYENMLIANMDFADFADSVDDDGIFRGFRGVDSPPTAAPTSTTSTDTGVPPLHMADEPPSNDTIAPTVNLAFGQRWPGDTVSRSPDDGRLMTWDDPTSPP